MDRIGPAGGAPTQTLSNGQQGFVDENLSAGQQGTNVPAEWLDAVQEELMSVLAAAGTVPNIANFGQVLASLGVLFGLQFQLSGQSWAMKIPNPSNLAQPFLVQGGVAIVPASVSQVQQPLLVPLTALYVGGVCSDTGGDCFQCGVQAGTDLRHATINCLQEQTTAGGIVTRGAAAAINYLVAGV